MTSPYEPADAPQPPPLPQGAMPTPLPQGAMPAPKKPLWKRWWVWLIAIILILIIGFAIAVAVQVHKIKALDAEAVEQCKEQVLEHAKYPGGVVFVDEPVVTSDNITVNERGNDVLSMGGDVDFPNGFGTPTRGAYLCLTEVEGYEILKTKAMVTGFD